ncbi:MAG: hypothetical protein OXI11_02095 [Gammaproteobacteria bacterium]|nr:hypothetical protein [Gammaproteobacteria bacterium]
MATTLYHLRHAPKGKTFEETKESLKRLEADGWVDDPAKIGVNLWPDESPGAEGNIKEIMGYYMSGRILGIEGVSEGVNSQPRCPIWRSIASTCGIQGDGEYFESPRAGGRYFIFRRATAVLEDQERYSDRFRARLTSWLVEQRRLGNDCPHITLSTLEEAENLRDLTVDRRADLLLQYIGLNTPHIGDYFRFWPRDIFCVAMAWSESAYNTEVSYLLNYLTDKNWLKADPLGEHDTQYLLTVEGYARLAELGNTVRESSQAFVAMWFDPSMESVWRDGMKPAIEDAGYEPLRIDLKPHANKIDDEIIAEIRRSRFIVADFTHGEEGARGSVYYEAGFAHGLNIPVIFTCRRDMFDNIHFDTRQYLHIVWEKPEDLRQQLAPRVSALLGDGPSR